MVRSSNSEDLLMHFITDSCLLHASRTLPISACYMPPPSTATCPMVHSTSERSSLISSFIRWVSCSDMVAHSGLTLSSRVANFIRSPQFRAFTTAMTIQEIHVLDIRLRDFYWAICIFVEFGMTVNSHIVQQNGGPSGGQVCLDMVTSSLHPLCSIVSVRLVTFLHYISLHTLRTTVIGPLNKYAIDNDVQTMKIFNLSHSVCDSFMRKRSVDEVILLLSELSSWRIEPHWCQYRNTLLLATTLMTFLNFWECDGDC